VKQSNYFVKQTQLTRNQSEVSRFCYGTAVRCWVASRSSEQN